MTVHLQIADQVKKHREAQKQFLALDAQRERAIEDVLTRAKAGAAVQTTEINDITNKMNQIAMQFQFPPRKLVTKDMVVQFLNKTE
ncbi:hypothetical protein JCM9140_3197 [Halalkalibacter wakoensis JCM 9140]|uniref:DUF2533 family protein n=1 Tax=Halalkalibacter wakoensis JCM 9140 TaxID=1236970 RepID=W4Q6U0_9BACI|nr:DUF2533 family protein [Halalkalibacter wakoensis]GAE27084.1 hypothetical protein JCM9140_3197 [Halalkalibacter wakoensis JCM 9140]